MAETTPPSPDAQFLREIWSRERLGDYEGQWIAVSRREILAHGVEMEAVMEASSNANPLYAFVTFRDLQ